MLSDGERVMCAFSGGVDSSVMLDVLIRLGDELGITVCAAHLNHMLRGEASLRDEEFVKRICNDRKIPLICSREDVEALAKQSGESIELAARHARYEFLYRAAGELSADKIATAHNANDNLETLLLNLARGSGISGMCGIPPVRGNIVRPLISVSRRDIEKYAAENMIEHCEDATNAETVYSRNKLRHLVVPVLREINDEAVANASRSSGIMRHEAQFLDATAEKATESISIPSENACLAESFLSLHPALSGRVAEIFAKKALGEELYTLEYKHIEAIKALARDMSPSKKLSMPGGLTVRREYEKLIFEKQSEKKTLEKTPLHEGELFWGKYRVVVKKTEKCANVHNSVNTFSVSCDRITGSLFIRGRETGDYIKLKNRPGKTIKKLFIDEHIPLSERDGIPIIADENEVVAIYGFGVASQYAAKVGEPAMYIEITEETGV